MAFVSNLDDDEKKNPAQGVVAPIGGNSVHLAPSSGVGAAGNSGGASNAPDGGHFATLQTYLGANQGRASDLSDNITKGIGDQYNSLQGANTSTLQGIQGQVDQGYTPENQSVLSQESANPVSFASNPGNVSAFQAQANDKYTGPSSAESTPGYQNQWASVNNAIAQGQGNVGTEAGREGLLKGVESRPTAGVTALNSAILSQDPNAQNKIETAYQPFSQLTDQLSKGAQGINSNIGQAQSQASDANAKANAQIAQQSNAFTTGLNSTLTKAQGDVNKYNTGLQDYTTSVAANQPLIGAINDSGLFGQFGMSNPFTASYSPFAAPTANSVATPTQLATQNSLNTLGGNVHTLDPNATVGGYSAPGAVPTQPNYADILDRLALAESSNFNQAPGLPTTAVGLSGLTDMAGAPTGPGGAANYSTQIVPFQKLMQQLSQLYGNQYVSPIRVNNQNVGYKLNS